MRLRHPSAFTLVELLVVVAILAVLAAIAVPSFMAASTRAKVSRVKNDLRAVALALDAYRADQKHYPPYHYAPKPSAPIGVSFHVGGSVVDLYNSPAWSGANPLTTPVAYLTAFPEDPFASRASDDAPETAQYFYVNWDYAIDTIPGDTSRVFRTLRRSQGSWRLHSNGPDKHGPDSELLDGQVIYSPSNGTVSRGDIVRTQLQGQL